MRDPEQSNTQRQNIGQWLPEPGISKGEMGTGKEVEALEMNRGDCCITT